MSNNFGYLDIILLAMIAGFIFLRLRGILGKKSGYEDEMASSFPHDFSKEPLQKNQKNILIIFHGLGSFMEYFQVLHGMYGILFHMAKELFGYGGAMELEEFYLKMVQVVS